MPRPPFALLSVVAVLGVGLVAGGDGSTAGPRPTAVRETRPVDGAVAVCPELLKEGEDVISRLTAGVATEGEVTVRAATLTPGEGLGAVVLDQGATVGALNLKSESAVAAIITATGDQSGGLEVEQVSRGADGPNRGWAGTRCEAPTADSWFLGGTTVVGHSSQLVLVNPFDDPALVRVEIYGAKGVVDVPELDGIVLKPRARVVRELANLVPDESLLAVHVVAREGRVAPAIRVHRTRGTLPLGVDWLPRLTEPGTQVDIPGIPTGNGARRVYVYVPGEDAAYLRVQLTLPDGQIVPAGFDDIRVEPGRPVVLNLAEVLTVVDQRTAEKTMRPVGVRIYAEGAPVFATAFADSKSRYLAIREMSFLGPAEPLTGPTLVTEARNKGRMDCQLLFHAPDGPAKVTIRTLLSRNEKAKSVSKVVTIPQGELVVFPYSKLPEDPLQSVVITPDPTMARVYASRHIFEFGRRGPLFTTQALVTQPTAGYDVPAVYADPTAALPVDADE